MTVEYFLRVILAQDCLRSFPDSVWVPILLILPGLARFQGVFPFKIGKALDCFPLFPGEFEIDVLKLVVKADLAGVRESCAEIDPINPCPIDGAHAHRTGRSIHVKVAAFEHLRAFGNWIGRPFGTRNHLQISLIIIRAEKGFGIDPAAGVHDGGHLGVKNRNSSQKDPVLSTADDLAVSHNDSTKRSAPSFLDGLDGQPGGLVEELFFILVTFNICSAHVFVFFCIDCGVRLRGNVVVCCFLEERGTDEFVACMFISHKSPKDCNQIINAEWKSLDHDGFGSMRPSK